MLRAKAALLCGFIAGLAQAKLPGPADHSLRKSLQRRDSTFPDTTFAIADDLSLWLFKNSNRSLPALNYASTQSTLSSFSDFLANRIKTASDQTLSKTNDDPLVWSGDATTLSPSQRLTFIISNRPAGDNLTVNTAANSVTGLTAFMKANPDFDLDYSYIMQQSAQQPAPSEIGFIATLIDSKATPNKSSVPQSSTVTWPVPNNSTLQIRVDLSDAAARGSIDPQVFLDSFYDARQVAANLAESYFNTPLKSNSHENWAYRQHAAGDSTPFDLSVTQRADTAGWSTLVNVLDGYAQAVNASGLFYGSTFSVSDKSSTDTLLFSGALVGNGTDPVIKSVQTTTNSNPVTTPSSTSSPSSANQPVTAASSVPNPPPTDQPTIKGDSSQVRFTQSSSGTCMMFKPEQDSNPNPFDKAMRIFSDGAAANFTYNGGPVTYFYKPDKVGGRGGTNVGVTATFTPCWPASRDGSSCAAGAKGKDITPLRDLITAKGGQFCGSVGGTLGANGQYKFMLELDAVINPSFNAQGSVKNSAPPNPDWASKGK